MCRKQFFNVGKIDKTWKKIVFIGGKIESFRKKVLNIGKFDRIPGKIPVCRKN